MFEEHSSSFSSPYLYNGKELDRETGLYYYGARYYDPKVSIFVNVDPLVEKTMTSYAYVNNNPVMLVDPTGMESEGSDGDYYSKEGQYLGSDGIKDGKVYLTTDKIVKNNTSNGKTDWNNVKEFITTIDFTTQYGLNNEEMLDRANWIYAEGGGDFPEYYAFAMNNFREKAGSESSMYKYGMQDTDPNTQKTRKLDKNKYFSGGYENQQGKTFWNARKNMSTMTTKMEDVIAAVFKVKLEPSSDPTSGSNQWRGGKGSGIIQLTNNGVHWHRFFRMNDKYKGQAPIIDTRNTK